MASRVKVNQALPLPPYFSSLYNGEPGNEAIPRVWIYNNVTDDVMWCNTVLWCEWHLSSPWLQYMENPAVAEKIRDCLDIIRWESIGAVVEAGAPAPFTECTQSGIPECQYVCPWETAIGSVQTHPTIQNSDFVVVAVCTLHIISLIRLANSSIHLTKLQLWLMNAIASETSNTVVVITL